MNQILSLKKLSCYSDIYKKYNPIIIGARDCLTNLSELSCPSNIKAEFFYQLSQICHNIKTLNITYLRYIPDGLNELISSQHSLKILSLIQSNYYYCYDCYDDDSSDEESDEEDDSSNLNITEIVSSLTKHLDTITELFLYSTTDPLLPFVENINDIYFPQLQKLKILIEYGLPKFGSLNIFLVNNGSNLKEFDIVNKYNIIHRTSLDKTNLTIAKFCPRMELLSTQFFSNERDTLIKIFENCQQLKSIKFSCDNEYLDIKDLLNIIINHSPKNFYELKLIYPELYPENLESFFVSWKNRESKKSISLIIVNDYYGYYNDIGVNGESMKIIEKYKNLGVIKKFETRKYCDEEMYL